MDFAQLAFASAVIAWPFTVFVLVLAKVLVAMEPGE